eukprot:6190590-Pleurochrysis_carterae.AAC.1
MRAGLWVAHPRAREGVGFAKRSWTESSSSGAHLTLEMTTKRAVRTFLWRFSKGVDSSLKTYKRPRSMHCSRSSVFVLMCAQEIRTCEAENVAMAVAMRRQRERRRLTHT